MPVHAHAVAILGAVLFERGKNTLTLTPAGELYLNYIHNAKKLRESLDRDLQQLNYAHDIPLSLNMSVLIWY